MSIQPYNYTNPQKTTSTFSGGIKPFVYNQGNPIAEFTQPKKTGLIPNIIGGLKIIRSDIKDVWSQPKSDSGPISAQGYLNQVQGWGEDVISSWQKVGNDFSKIDTQKTVLDRTIGLGQTGLSVINAFFTPITSVFTRAESAPGIVGKTASFVNKLFGTVGVIGADTGESLVQATPLLSQDTKDKITPLVKEISALGAQIVVGKVGGDVYNKLASKTKIVIDKISEDTRIKTLNKDIPKDTISKGSQPIDTTQLSEPTIKPFDYSKTLKEQINAPVVPKTAPETTKGWKTTVDKGGIPGEYPIETLGSGKNQVAIFEVDGEPGVILKRTDGSYLYNPETRNALFDTPEKAKIEYAKQSNPPETTITPKVQYATPDQISPMGRVKTSEIDNVFSKIPDGTTSPDGYIQKIGEKLYPTEKATPELLKNSGIPLNADGSIKEGFGLTRMSFTEDVALNSTPKVDIMESSKLISHEGAPDIKTVAQYKLDIQAKKPIEPLKIIQEGNKFGIEDGKHRFQAYQELGITKIPVEIIKSKVLETPIAVAPKPIEIKTDTQLQSSVFERMKAEHPQIEGDLGYDPIKLKADADKAVELIARDKQKAYDIAMGKETSAEMTSTGVNIALAEKALGEGNYDLYARLIKNRSLEQTRRGQEIVAERGSVTDNSTSKYVKELIASRLEKLGNSYLSDLKNTLKRTTNKGKATKVIDAEVAKLDKAIKNKKLTVKDALKLLDELACI